MTRKLTRHPSAQCHIDIVNETTSVFVSYDTQIALLENNELSIINPPRTVTTKKQLRWFVQEYTPAVKMETIRQLCNGIYNINYIDITTGKLVELVKPWIE